MKYLQRYLSLLFALVMSLGLFSVTAHAEEIDSTDYKLYIYAYDGYGAYGQVNIPNGGSGDIYKDGMYITYDQATGGYLWNIRHVIARTDGGIAFKKGKKYKVTVTGLYDDSYLYSDWEEINSSYSENYYEMKFENWVDTSGSIGGKGLSVDIAYSKTTGQPTYTFTFTASKDTTKIQIEESFIWRLDNCYTPSGYNFNWDFRYGAENLNITVDEQTEEAGLLSGILGWVQNIFNTVTDGFDNMLSAITELPQKIWNLISEGLKSLFVPSEESMTAYKDKWDELLESRLGAVYQVVHILTESWDQVMSADETNTVSFPSATVNLVGTDFTFGGYEVQIVPEGFETLAGTIKTLVGVVCTVAFVNGLRKRYDEIMGVEQ